MKMKIKMLKLNMSKTGLSLIKIKKIFNKRVKLKIRDIL